MEVHTFEKVWTAAALLLIVGFVVTITYGSLGAGVEMVSDEGGTVSPGAVGTNGLFTAGYAWADDDGDREELVVNVLARQFLFQPGTQEPIRVPADTRVTFRVTSGDVVHGFSITGTNVNTMVIPGQVAEITVRFDEPGEHGLVCHEYCGAGHHTMEGKVVVVPAEEYEVP
jgi:cytochrome c oxidase subunit 2